MIRRIALLVIVFIIVLVAAPASAVEPDSGTIEGQVVNGTAGSNSSVTDLEITLKTYLNDTEIEPTITTTDAEGQFIFDGLSTVSGYSYETTLIFQEAEYFSERLSFGEGETARQVTVNVYDATTSDEAIRVEMSHTLIYVEQGSLWVEEYYLFMNESDRAYIGSNVVAEGKKETLRFSLPGEAIGLQYGLDLMQCCVYDNEDGFVDTMPVLPGGKEISYAYQVDYDSGTYTFAKRMNYPVVRFDLLVQGESVEVASEQLTINEPMDIEGIWFNHLSGSDFIAGDISLTRLSSLPQTADSQQTIMWVTMALVVLITGFVVIYQLKKRRLQPVSRGDSLDQKRREMLVELARLDDDFEGGRIAEDVYRRLREEKKTQLVELMKGSKGENSEG